MNRANVEALARLLVEFGRQPPRLTAINQDWGDEEQRYMALWLAARGVLVPAALTDEDLGTAWGKSQCYDWFDPTDFRAALECIAKGDPA